MIKDKSKKFKECKGNQNNKAFNNSQYLIQNNKCYVKYLSKSMYAVHENHFIYAMIIRLINKSH